MEACGERALTTAAIARIGRLDSRPKIGIVGSSDEVVVVVMVVVFCRMFVCLVDESSTIAGKPASRVHPGLHCIGLAVRQHPSTYKHSKCST